MPTRSVEIERRQMGIYSYHLNRAAGAPFISPRTIANIPILKSIQIPLPPLDVQKEIVEEIEGYQRVINGARTVLDNYRPHIPIHPDWPILELGQVIESK